jgi:hypothetical protein
LPDPIAAILDTSFFIARQQRRPISQRPPSGVLEVSVVAQVRWHGNRDAIELVPCERR